jgi:hypothetical protein
MEKRILTLIFSLATTLLFGQTSFVSNEILSMKATTNFFTDSLCKQFNIDFPFRRVYKCTDKSGVFFIVLTERNDTIVDKDTLHYKIKAFNFQQGNNGLVKKWEMNDFITHQANYLDIKDATENSIWFWTKYSEFSDIDGDSLIDPILTYGTSAMNGTDDGRIKILVYYKGQKFAIRHQNGVLDFERNTHVDKEFYSLPATIQVHVKQIMQKMTTDNNAIFPYGWQDAMKKHKLKFDERGN